MQGLGFLVHLIPLILSWRCPVCDGKEVGGTATSPGTSVVQWGPGAPVGLVQCVPCFCAPPPPSFPRGWLEEARQEDPNHRASWVGGTQEMGRENR